MSNKRIDKSSVSNRAYSGQVSVSTTPVELLDSSFSYELVRGVTIKSLPTNTGILYVGGPDVSSSTGYPLAAGDSLFLPVEKFNTVNLVSSSGSQTVAFIGM